MELIERYPELAKIPKPRIDSALLDASQLISKKNWNKLYEQGLHALAAHLLYCRDVSHNASGKPIQHAISKTVDKVSVGYAPPDAGFGSATDGYAGSLYGQEYLRLRRLVGLHFLSVR